MDKITTQIFSLLPNNQQQELLEKAVKCLQEKVRVIVSDLPAEKLILAHEYLTNLTTEQKEQIKQRPPPSYVSTPDESDDYSDMPPLVNDTSKAVKNIYSGWAQCDNNGQQMFSKSMRK